VAVRFESRAGMVTAVAGGSESHGTPASAAVKGDDGGRSTYQSPACPLVGHNNTALRAVNSRARPGSPVAITSRAALAARVSSAAATGARVAPSRQRPASVSTNTRTGRRATSLRVRARNRASQSGGEAKITAAGSRLTSTAKRRLSSRGSASLIPSRRTSSTCHPGFGIRESGIVTSVEIVPLSGSVTRCEVSRRSPTLTVIDAFRAPSPESRVPATP